MYCYEIYLTKPSPTLEDWQRLCECLFGLLPNFSNYKIEMRSLGNCIHYYLQYPYELPAVMGKTDAFLVRRIPDTDFLSTTFARLVFTDGAINFIELANTFSVKYHQVMTAVLINFIKTPGLYFSIVTAGSEDLSCCLIAANPEKILSLDFEKNRYFTYKKLPEIFKLEKVLDILSDTSTNAVFEVTAFPYSQKPRYLSVSNYSFIRHSLIVGASGSGKSKLLSLMADNIIARSEDCRVVIIDPHASLGEDLLSRGQIIDFQSDARGVDLFSEKQVDIAAATEIMFDLLYALIGHSSPNLARVLRYAVYVLLAGECFSFVNLRRLLFELEYRNELLNRLGPSLPENVMEFFLTDFNELRTKFYADAVSPITTFLEELALTPILERSGQEGLPTILERNVLTVFSLDRMKLGGKATTTIINLLLQQIFVLVRQHPPSSPILLMIDEVAIIKSPVLKLILAESRKYNLYLVLATQYLGQLDDEMRKAVFANVVNYYIFRVARDDANILADNLEVKDPRTLTKLNFRECIVRIEAKGKLIPIFKAKTRSFKGANNG